MIHECGLVHRDIKPENILVDSANNIAVCDFGFAYRIENRILSQEILNNRIFGTLRYLAPEVIRWEDYTNKIDIWSVGLIMIMLYTQKMPFS